MSIDCAYICEKCPGRDDCPEEEAVKQIRVTCPAEIFLLYAAPKMLKEDDEECLDG